MKVLYVSRSSSGKPHPFISEQAAALIKNHSLNITHLLIRGGGVIGYAKAAYRLSDYIRRNNPDIIHVHYGLSALIVVANKLLHPDKFKTIITYHGSDINRPSERPFSLLSARLSNHNILVSRRMLPFFKSKCSVVPCGINTDAAQTFRESTRENYGWGDDIFVVLFSSNFTRQEKDPAFAQQVTQSLSQKTSKTVILLELKGYSRDEVTKLMQAADALLMCSHTEGSPQVVKEAIFNSLPVVSNDVGDVKLICEHVDHCYILPKTVKAYVECLYALTKTYPRIQNREPVIAEYSNQLISDRLFNIYQSVLLKAIPVD